MSLGVPFAPRANKHTLFTVSLRVRKRATFMSSVKESCWGANGERKEKVALTTPTEIWLERLRVTLAPQSSKLTVNLKTQFLAQLAPLLFAI